MTESESPLAYRRIQPSAFDDDARITRNEGRGPRDEPMDTPESASTIFEAVLGILLGCVIFASLMLVAWPVVVFALGGI